MVVVGAIDVGLDGVLALYLLSATTGSHTVPYQASHTGGISLGRSTALTMESAPFSMGHSRSTFLISLQRSAVVLIRRI